LRNDFGTLLVYATARTLHVTWLSDYLTLCAENTSEQSEVGVFANNLKLNSVALVRKRTIPTERPPLVGEVSANFCG
jgi:hypothetical protein